MNGGTPPGLGRLLLRLIPLGSRRAEVEADLLELFGERATSRGVRYARLRYYGDVLSLWGAREARVMHSPVPGIEARFSARSRAGPVICAAADTAQPSRRGHRGARAWPGDWRQHVSLQLLERRHVPTDWHRRSRVDCACDARVCRRFRNVVALFRIPAASRGCAERVPRRLVSRRRLHRVRAGY